MTNWQTVKKHWVERWPDWHPIILEYLWRQDIDVESVDNVVRFNYESDLHDPFLLPDMAIAVERIITALHKDQKIVIFGDYDADGLPGIAILDAFFKKIEFKIPGLSKESIQPVGIRLDNKRQLAYVALGPANRVAIINMKTFEVEKYILTGQRVWNLIINSNGTRLYTTNGVSNDISVIDIEKRKVIKSIPVGRYPWGVVVKE